MRSPGRPYAFDSPLTMMSFCSRCSRTTRSSCHRAPRLDRPHPPDPGADFRGAVLDHLARCIAQHVAGGVMRIGDDDQLGPARWRCESLRVGLPAFLLVQLKRADLRAEVLVSPAVCM